jgi:hypothetical protein
MLKIGKLINHKCLNVEVHPRLHFLNDYSQSHKQIAIIAATLKLIIISKSTACHAVKNEPPIQHNHIAMIVAI